MEMPRLGVTMVLCLTHVDIVSSCSQIDSCSIPATIDRAHTVLEFNCACLKEKEHSIRLNHKCSFNFPDRGREFMEHIFPRDCSEYPSAITRPTSQTVDVDVNNNSGTIADAVNNYDCVLSGNIWLLICVERIFQYRQTRFELNSTQSQHNNGSQTDGRNVAWSMIGRDMNGEYCEVTLGSLFSDIKSKPSSLSIQEESKVSARPTVENIHTEMCPSNNISTHSNEDSKNNLIDRETNLMISSKSQEIKDCDFERLTDDLYTEFEGHLKGSNNEYKINKYWEAVSSRSALGKIFKLTGLTLIKRIPKIKLPIDVGRVKPTKSDRRHLALTQSCSAVM
ncbi:unnamed protein product [Timema podura]|uniref:Uncharacterized protein n=1 Tax=Timema podura TaxID=61482 RepID=A0ABN7PGA6_TIMPD|nr:unnamed protein product [Timema podura]